MAAAVAVGGGGDRKRRRSGVSAAAPLLVQLADVGDEKAFALALNQALQRVAQLQNIPQDTLALMSIQQAYLQALARHHTGIIRTLDNVAIPLSIVGSFTARYAGPPPAMPLHTIFQAEILADRDVRPVIEANNVALATVLLREQDTTQPCLLFRSWPRGADFFVLWIASSEMAEALFEERKQLATHASTIVELLSAYQRADAKPIAVLQTILRLSANTAAVQLDHWSDFQKETALRALTEGNDVTTPHKAQVLAAFLSSAWMTRDKKTRSLWTTSALANLIVSQANTGPFSEQTWDTLVSYLVKSVGASWRNLLEYPVGMELLFRHPANLLRLLNALDVPYTVYLTNLAEVPNTGGKGHLDTLLAFAETLASQHILVSDATLSERASVLRVEARLCGAANTQAAIHEIRRQHYAIYKRLGWLLRDAAAEVRSVSVRSRMQDLAIRLIAQTEGQFRERRQAVAEAVGPAGVEEANVLQLISAFEYQRVHQPRRRRLSVV